MSQQFVSPVFRQIVLPGTGITARFEAGVPRPLRKSLQQFALSQGIMIFREDMKEMLAAAQADSQTADDELAATLADDNGADFGEETTIESAIAQLVAGGKPEDFTKNGNKPQVKSLEAILGKDITTADRDEAWARFTADADE